MSKRSVAFTKPSEPSFIRKLKEQVGYKEGPTVDTKREHLSLEEPEDREDREDEKPIVVVLKPGDLNEEEAEKIQEDLEKKEEDKLINEGKMTFRKPDKRASESNLNVTSSKKRKSVEDEESPKLQKKSSMNQVKNTNLLSFDQYEDSDEIDEDSDNNSEDEESE